MNILNFNNLQTESITNKIKIDKYNQNPISFKGLITNDTFERTLTYPDKKQEEKQRVEEKVNAQIAKYNVDIFSINQEINSLQEVLKMSENIEFSDKIDSLLLNYLDAEKLKKLTSKKALKKGIDSEKISEIIINYDNRYQDKYNKKQPTEEELLKDARRIIKANSEENFITNCTLIIKKFCTDNSINIKDETIQLYVSCLLETKNQSNSDFISSLSEIFDKKIKYNEEKKENIQNRIDSLNQEKNEYFTLLENNSDFAPYYEPLASYSDRIQKLLDSGKFKRPDNDLYPKNLFWHLSNFGLVNYFEHTGLLYTEDEENKKTLGVLSEKEGKLKSQKDIEKQYHLSESEIESLELPQIKFERKNNKKSGEKEIVLYDVSNEETIEKLEKEAKNAEKRRERTTVRKSKYAYGEFMTLPEENNITAKELEKLGYGNAKLIRNYVQRGILPGSIQEVQSPDGTKYRTTVNLEDSKTPDVLKDIRKDTTEIMTVSNLSKYLGITIKNLIKMIEDGEVDIIHEYLFLYENNTKYVDTRTEKNKAFIERKLFEKELAEQIKKQETERQKQEAKERKIARLDALSKYQSLKMTLVWHFCPQTRDIASSMAVQDGYLCQLLVKDSDDNEKLTRKEEIKVNSYRKKMWNRAGTDELKEGYKKAEEILSVYHTKGITGIEDAQIREILEQYEAN